MGVIWVLIAPAVLVCAFFSRWINNIKTVHRSEYENYVGIIDLIDEMEIDLSTVSLEEFASQCADEARFIWNCNHHWIKNLNCTDLVVQSAFVRTRPNNQEFSIQRAFAVVPCQSASALFSYLSSAEGFAVIDPVISGH